MSEDITYCYNTKCRNIKCERHAHRITQHYIPHSFAFFKDCEWWDLPEQYFEASRDMADLIDKRDVLETFAELFDTFDDNKMVMEALDKVAKKIRDLPYVKHKKCSEILEQMKSDDFYDYVHTGKSKFSAGDWDWLIRTAKNVEEIYG